MMIVCPLTVLLAFMSLAAKLGNPDVAREFFLSATVVLALFGVGLVVRAILRQTHGRESRDRLERIAATSTTFAVWGVVAVSVVLIPALSRAKNGPVSTAPEEASLRAALDGAGADIVLDTHGQIRSIELCDASDDQILGVGTLPRVSGIFIHGEGVTDAGMAYIAHLQDLETLDISATRVTSVGIRWIRGFSHLKVLNLSETDVDDSGLAHVKDLRELQVLLLSGTKVTDVGMMHLAGLRALKTLHLNGTAISGKGLARLSGIEELEELNLEHTMITGSSLQHILSFSSLRQLELGYTAVGDPPMSGVSIGCLSGLSNLRRLGLRHTQLSDRSIPVLESMTDLRSLELTGTHLTKAGLRALRHALPNTTVERF